MRNTNLGRNTAAPFRTANQDNEFSEAITSKYIPDDDHIMSKHVAEVTLMKGGSSLRARHLEDFTEMNS
jgi:hypothetical protein